jgi:hypothetical protein
MWLNIPDCLPLHSYDGSHLHIDSAQRLSDYIGKEIRPMLTQHPFLKSKKVRN